MRGARLACVKHAASVHSEPGSNSQVHSPPDPERPSSSEPPCTHSLTDDFPTIPRSPDTKPNHTQGTRPSQAQHPGADRASHPLTSSPPTSHQHQGRYHSHPSAQHPAIHTGQPRTKHFQNRCTCQRTTPDRPEITSGEVTIRQSSETPLPQRANEPKAPTPARQPRITSGVAGFYAPWRNRSTPLPPGKIPFRKTRDPDLDRGARFEAALEHVALHEGLLLPSPAAT